IKYQYTMKFDMSKNERTSANFLNETKEVEEKKNKKDKHEQIERDRIYITPNEFKSKSPKKDNQEFFVSRINKTAKYTKDSNFFSYFVYRIGKDDASGLSAQLSYYFMITLLPFLFFFFLFIHFYFFINNQSTYPHKMYCNNKYEEGICFNRYRTIIIIIYR